MTIGTGSRVGPFEIVGPIGAGGMGEVFLAQDARLGRRVALKVLPEAFRGDADRKRRFIQEARAASALQHPSIVTIYDIVETDDADFIAMEYVEGETLRDVIGRGAVDVRQAMEWTAQAAGALAAAHDAGIVHRDIKPENLIVTKSGEIKILDFGLARIAVTTSSDPNQLTEPQLATAAGMILGTAAYMSPEQATGKTVGAASDIFSLGAVLYEMLTGRRPFRGSSVVEVMHSVIHDSPPPVEEVATRTPPEVSDIVAKAMAKLPRDRYRHAGDLELDCRRAQHRPATAPAIATRSRSLWWPVIAIVSILLAIVCATAFFRLRPNGFRHNQRPALEKAILTPLTSDPGLVNDPSFSPDGESIVFASNRGGNFDIFLKQISGGPDVNLTNNPADDVQPSLSPDGKQIAFVSTRESVSTLHYIGTENPLRGGDIWVMPALGGSARKIATDGNFPSWSPDGSTILFSRSAYSRPELVRVPAAGGEAESIPFDDKDRALFRVLSYPSYSRDGKWIVAESSSEVMLLPESGGHVRRLAAGRSPIWAPQYHAILYSSAEPGKNYSIWMMPFDSATGATGPAWPLTVGRGTDGSATLSRDGQKLVFAAAQESFNVESYPFDADSGRIGAAHLVTAGDGISYFQSFSPDAKWVVYESRRGSISHLWRRDGDADPVQLTSDPQFTDRLPRVSPDGTRIAYIRRAVQGTGGDTTPGTLAVMRTDGAAPHPLYGPIVGIFAWSPDSRGFYCYSSRAGETVYVDAASGAARTLPRDPQAIPVFAVSHDGQWLVYQSRSNGNVGVSAAPLAGGAPRLVLSLPTDSFHPFFSPSGRWLYVQRDHKNLFRVPGPASGWRPATPEQVTHFPESGLFLEDPQLSFDGSHLLISHGHRSGDLWLLNIGEVMGREK